MEAKWIITFLIFFPIFIGSSVLALEISDKEAQFQLALKYANGGEGVDLDPKKACQWFLKAAEQEHLLAQYNTGVCYLDGLGGTKDPTQAFQWFLKAANQGHTESIYNIALAYHFGHELVSKNGCQKSSSFGVWIGSYLY